MVLNCYLIIIVSFHLVFNGLSLNDFCCNGFLWFYIGPKATSSDLNRVFLFSLGVSASLNQKNYKKTKGLQSICSF